MSRVRTLAVIAIANIVIGASGCGDAVAPRVELERARVTWARANIDTYVFVVRRTCECLPAGSGPVEVDVRNGAVQSRTYLDGTQVRPEIAHVFPDVPGLFAMIEDAMNRRPDRMSVEYDAHSGFPKEVFVDFSASVGDDEMIYSTSLIPSATIR